jgi:hypothetical protein
MRFPSEAGNVLQHGEGYRKGESSHARNLTRERMLAAFLARARRVDGYGESCLSRWIHIKPKEG